MFETFKARRVLTAKEDKAWAKGVTKENHLEKLLDAAKTNKPERVSYIFKLFREDYLSDRSKAADAAVVYEAPAALREILKTEPQAFGSNPGADALIMAGLFGKAAACERPEIWDALYDHNARRFAALAETLPANMNGVGIRPPFLLPSEIAGIAAANNHAEGLARALKDSAGTPFAGRAVTEAMGGALRKGTVATLKTVIAALPSLLEPEEAQAALNHALVRAAAMPGRLAKLDLLLDAGADANASHCAALTTAAIRNRHAVRDRLIAAGADVRPHMAYLAEQEAARERLLAGAAIGSVGDGPGIMHPPIPMLVIERLAEMAEAAEMRKAGLGAVEKVTLTLRRPAESGGGPLSLTFNFTSNRVTTIDAGAPVTAQPLDEPAAGDVRREAERLAGQALRVGAIPRPGRGG